MPDQNTAAAAPVAATPTAAQTAEAYVVTQPGYGYAPGARLTDATKIAALKQAGTLARFAVRVAPTQEK